MKRAVKELDSFIYKFYQLWNSGVNAHLDIDTHAGEAWVGLRVRLGHAPFPHHVNQFDLPRNRDSPSRQRRRVRRAAEREQGHHVEQTDVEAEEAVPLANVAESEAEAEESTEQANVAAKVTVATAPITGNAIGPATEAEEARHCDLCDVTLKNIRGLKAHNSRVHKKIPQFDGPCEELEETVTFLSDYVEEDIKLNTH